MTAATEQLPIDARIAELAAAQHGVVARAQLRAMGLTDAAIAWRVRVGRLHRVRAPDTRSGTWHSRRTGAGWRRCSRWGPTRC